jgi:hypothetical protein
MMVIIHGHIAGILISLVAVDRIENLHKAAVLAEKKKKEEGMQYLLESYAQHR